MTREQIEILLLEGFKEYNKNRTYHFQENGKEIWVFDNYFPYPESDVMFSNYAPYFVDCFPKKFNFKNKEQIQALKTIFLQ
jgi:hypothetical protein